MFQTMATSRALIWCILAGFLLLPVNVAFDFSGVPSLDKSSIPSVAALIFCLLFARKRWKLLPDNPLLLALIAVFILTPLATAAGNAAPIMLPDRVIPPMNWYDALTQAASNAITLIPFLLGHAFLKGEQNARELLKCLVMAGLAYSIPMLLEVRLSPQLHALIYGFFPHQFLQQMRDGGFRPVVFLGHGLLVAAFCAAALIAAVAMWRDRSRLFRLPGYVPPIYLAGMLVLCKSLGALVIAAILVPCMALLKPRAVVLISAALSLMVITYPAIRTAGLVPIETISQISSQVSEDRESSFSTRVEHENLLMTKSSEKPFFGWGSWGRNRIYSEKDGSDISVTDGTWIIILGMWGWLGYLALFGLLGAPAIRAIANAKKLSRVTLAEAGLFAILTLTLLDLIPNSSLRPITWLIAGCLAALQFSAKKTPPLSAGA